MPSMLIVILLALYPASAGAAAATLEDACGNEVRMFCPEAGGVEAAARRCLAEHRTGLMTPCRAWLKSTAGPAAGPRADTPLPAAAPSSAPVKGGARRLYSAVPISGKESPGVEALDRVMLKAFKRIGGTSGSLAVADHGVRVHARGYGWSDLGRTVPMQPDTMMGVASCEKPVTGAAVRKLAREGRLDLNAGVFAALHVEPRGPVQDERVRAISILNLLEHKAGWGPDPVTPARKAALRAGLAGAIPVETLLGFIMTQKMTYAPGTKDSYCNFCYDVLRHLVEKTTGRSAGDYFRDQLFRPGRVAGFSMTGEPGDKVWNSDSGGPVHASAPALLEFMRHYWYGGEPRDDGHPLWIKTGGAPGSTALMVWRPDGIDYVALFNKASAPESDLAKELDAALDRLKAEHGGRLQ